MVCIPQREGSNFEEPIVAIEVDSTNSWRQWDAQVAEAKGKTLNCLTGGGYHNGQQSQSINQNCLTLKRALWYWLIDHRNLKTEIEEWPIQVLLDLCKLKSSRSGKFR